MMACPTVLSKTLNWTNRFQLKFTDPCPEVAKEQMQTMKEVDYVDKKMKKLRFGPSAWSTGHPAPECTPEAMDVHQAVDRKWYAGQRRGLIQETGGLSLRLFAGMEHVQKSMLQFASRRHVSLL